MKVFTLGMMTAVICSISFGAIATNIPNNDFEAVPTTIPSADNCTVGDTVTDGWKIASVGGVCAADTVALDPSDPYAGTFSLRITRAKSGHYLGVESSTITSVTPGEILKLTAWVVNRDFDTGAFAIGFRYYNGTRLDSKYTSQNTSTIWTKFTITHEVPAGVDGFTVFFEPTHRGTGRHYIDHIQVTRFVKNGDINDGTDESCPTGFHCVGNASLEVSRGWDGNHIELLPFAGKAATAYSPPVYLTADGTRWIATVDAIKGSRGDPNAALYVYCYESPGSISEWFGPVSISDTNCTSGCEKALAFLPIDGDTEKCKVIMTSSCLGKVCGRYKFDNVRLNSMQEHHMPCSENTARKSCPSGTCGDPVTNCGREIDCDTEHHFACF